MNKIPALFISLIITLVIAGNYVFFTTASSEREKVEIIRVLDGDTVELVDGRTIRLVNINTPEKKFPFSNLAKDYLTQYVGKEIYLESLGLDKYYRTLGRLFYNEEYLNKKIIESGMAHKYLVIDNEVKDFTNVEKIAIKNKKGIWQESSYYGCLYVEINKYDEYISLVDSCGVDFTGWTVKDESTKSYTFKKDFGERFILYSAKGKDTSTEAYWGKERVWNDVGDAIFIRDDSGLLVYYDSYG